MIYPGLLNFRITLFPICLRLMKCLYFIICCLMFKRNYLFFVFLKRMLSIYLVRILIRIQCTLCTQIPVVKGFQYNIPINNPFLVWNKFVGLFSRLICPVKYACLKLSYGNIYPRLILSPTSRLEFTINNICIYALTLCEVVVLFTVKRIFI